MGTLKTLPYAKELFALTGGGDSKTSGASACAISHARKSVEFPLPQMDNINNIKIATIQVNY